MSCGQSSLHKTVLKSIAWARNYSGFTMILFFSTRTYFEAKRYRCYVAHVIKMITTIGIPNKLIFGPGAINQLGGEAKALGKKRLMIVTYPDIRKVGILDKVLNLLDKAGITNPIVFEKVMPNPRVTMIDEGAVIARRQKVDFIIGLGGGSAMDSGSYSRQNGG